MQMQHPLAHPFFMVILSILLLHVVCCSAYGRNAFISIEKVRVVIIVLLFSISLMQMKKIPLCYYIFHVSVA